MNLFELKKYFDGKISIREFIDSERKDLEAYIKETKEKKKSIPVRADYEEFFDGYNSNDIRLLLSDYLKNELLEWDLDYIVQALDMLDEEPDDEKARYVVSCLSTPDIDAPISGEVACEYLNYLNSKVEMKKTTSNVDYCRKNYRSVLGL